MKSWMLPEKLNAPMLALIAVAMAVFGTELLLMVLLHVFFRPLFELPELTWSFIDAILLTIFVAPLLYFLVFRNIKESDGRLRATIENSLDAVVQMDAEGFITGWNGQSEKIFGWSSREAVGRLLHETIIPQQHREAHMQGLKHFLPSGEGPILNSRTEIVGLHRDGHEFPIELSIAAINMDGKYEFSAFIHDITKRKQAQFELQHNQNLLNEAQQLAKMGSWARDLMTGSFTCSEAISRILEIDLTHENISYETFILTVHPDDRETVDRAYLTCIQTREPFDIVHRLLLANGRVKWVNELGTFYYDSNGVPLRSIGTIQDITERKQSENMLLKYREHLEEMVKERTTALEIEINERKQIELKLREYAEQLEASASEQSFAEDRVRQILESTGEGLYGLDDEGRITFINHAACQMLGYEPEELAGKNAHTLFHHTRPDGSPYPVGECPMSATLTKGIVAHMDEEVFWRKDALAFPVEYTANPIRKGDWIVGAVVGFSDISARKRIEEELQKSKEAAEAANQAKSNFLSNMSHEIRTPLTPIIGFAETLLQDNPDTETRNSLLNAIVMNGRHLFNIINEILDLSKIEANKLEIEKIDVDISQLYQDIEFVAGTQARNKGLEFRQGFINPVPRRIYSDPTLIKQILMNLLTNAIKFTKRGHVGLHCEFDPERKQLNFMVSDTGLGIPQDKLVHLFKAFSQVDSSITRHYGGTGLGLYISQRLANLLGGGITVASREGGGSKFTVTIAAESSDMNDLISSPCLSKSKISYATGLPTSIPHLSGHVLLAEDSANNQLLVSHFVKRTGARISCAENGQTALEMAMANDYDLILMDMQMPVMGGVEAIELLRAAGCQIPIVALTANAMKGDREKYTSIGCNDFLGKPIRQHVFYEVLAKYLPKSSGDLPIRPATSMIEQDKEFLEMQAGFVASLDGYVMRLRQAMDCNDHAEMIEQAHQLKGLGGSFGFPKITDCASLLEAAMKANQYAQGKGLSDSLCGLLENALRTSPPETD